MYTPLGKRYADFEDAWILPGIEYEIALNDIRREINVLSPELIEQVEKELVEKING